LAEVNTLTGIGATTIANQLVLKAPLAGPTFSGTANFVTVSASGAITAASFGSATLAEVNTLTGIGATTIANQLVLKAPLAGPTFTGTANFAAISTSGAITSAGAITAASFGSATLAEVNTLTGIGATTIANQLILKAPLAGPTFTGTANFVTVSASGAITASNFGTSTQAEVNMLQGIGATTVAAQLALKAPLADPTFSGTTTCVTLNPSGVVTLSNATVSSATTSGALVVAGGVGVGGAINAKNFGTATGAEVNMLQGIGATTVAAQLALKAPLAGPTFSGTANFVTVSASGAITAASFGSATQAEVNMLQGIGATTVATQLGLKAPLAGPTFSGTANFVTVKARGGFTDSN
jgi:hypothetical protein